MMEMPWEISGGEAVALGCSTMGVVLLAALSVRSGFLVLRGPGTRRDRIARMNGYLGKRSVRAVFGIGLMLLIVGGMMERFYGASGDKSGLMNYPIMLWLIGIGWAALAVAIGMYVFGGRVSSRGQKRCFAAGLVCLGVAAVVLAWLGMSA